MMGKVIMSGIVPPLVAPVTGILAGDLAVGSSVYLMENGSAVEYLVVNQGIPSGSSLYDASCDGTWLLRNNSKVGKVWHNSSVNDYENSDINVWLNDDFLNLFGSIEKSVIKQVKIPYRKGSGNDKTVTSGESGLSVNVFLLSGPEVNLTSSTHSGIPDVGACLSYFADCASTDQKRIAYLNGSAAGWWTRAPYCTSNAGSRYCIRVRPDGSWDYYSVYNSSGIRPAIIIPSNALFDTNTLILKGVA